MESVKKDKALVFTAEGWKEVSADQLFVMPSAVGSIVYSYDPAEVPQVTSAEVIGYEHKSGEWWVIVKEHEHCGLTVRARVKDLGKLWFLDADDAKAAVSELDCSEALDSAYKEGIRLGKTEFAEELKEHIFRHYGNDRSEAGTTASLIMDMIDALMYGFLETPSPPKDKDFSANYLGKWGVPDG